MTNSIKCNKKKKYVKKKKKELERTAIELYNLEINKTIYLTPDEEKELARERKAGSLQARNKLVEKNLRLVRKITLNFVGKYGLTMEEYEDLLQYANEGVMHAANKFDDEKNCRFSTYATWWIRQANYRALVTPGLLRNDKYMPVGMRILKNKIPSYERQFKKEHGKRASRGELIDYVKAATRHRRDYIEAVVDIKLYNISLHTPLNHEDSSFLMDLIENKKSQRPEKVIIDIDNDEKRKKLDYYLSLLSEQEENVLRFRQVYLNDEVCTKYNISKGEIFDMLKFFGGNYTQRYRKIPRDKLTLEQVGKIFGLTRERIRQIEEKALSSLREKLLFNPVFEAEMIDFKKDLELAFPKGRESMEEMERVEVKKEINKIFGDGKRGYKKRNYKGGGKQTLRWKSLEKDVLEGYINLLPKEKQRQLMRLIYGVNDGDLREKYKLANETDITLSHLSEITSQNVAQIKKECEEMIGYIKEGVIPGKKGNVYKMRKALIEGKRDLAERALLNIKNSLDKNVLRLKYLLREETLYEDFPINGQKITNRQIGRILGIPLTHVQNIERNATHELWENMKLIREVEDAKNS